ncbi:hypothetical protein PMAYCL1PPCAC_18313, partial [Pristionchus mayeri]
IAEGMPDRRDSESSSSSSGDDEPDHTLANDLVVTKYGMAADIVNATLKAVITEIKEGVEVAYLCDFGDKLLMEKTSKIFKKEKDLQKGIAMPTCISIDNTICHFSPLRSDPPVKLESGQLVKIDLGAHVDGFIATAAHSVVVGASAENKVDEKKSNLLKGAYDALEIAIRSLRPGTKNMDITTNIGKVAEQYGVKAIENMVSHQLERNKIDGEKQIVQNPGEKLKSEVEKSTVEVHEVYAVDVLFTTGEGKARDLDTRTTVFKKSDEVVYQLKMKASRVFLSDAVAKSGSMPFTLRAFEDEVRAKMGVVECERHGLMRPYQVLYEKEGEYVAQFKATVLVLPNGLLKIAGLPLDVNTLNVSAKLEDPFLISKLNEALKPKKKKDSKKGDKDVEEKK